MCTKVISRLSTQFKHFTGIQKWYWYSSISSTWVGNRSSKWCVNLKQQLQLQMMLTPRTGQRLGLATCSSGHVLGQDDSSTTQAWVQCERGSGSIERRGSRGGNRAWCCTVQRSLPKLLPLFSMLGMETRALRMSGKCLVTELHPQSSPLNILNNLVLHIFVGEPCLHCPLKIHLLMSLDRLTRPRWMNMHWGKPGVTNLTR